MSNMSKRIFCIITHDKGLRFLYDVPCEIKSKLSHLNIEFEIFVLNSNDHSKRMCVEKIKNLPDNSKVIIFIHGGERYMTISRDGVRVAAGGLFEIPSDAYKNKHMIIIACNSATLIPEMKKGGASSIAGFGEIDFACDDLYQIEEIRTIERKAGKRPTRERFAKYLFRKALTDTIVYCETNNLPEYNFVKMFHYFSNFYADKLLLRENIDGRTITLSRTKRILIAKFMQNVKESVVCL